MLSHYVLVQVLRVKAYAQGTIRFARVYEGSYPLSRMGDRYDHSLLNHIIKSALYLLPVLDGNLLSHVLDRGNAGDSPDGIGPRHIAYGIIGVWGRLTSWQLCTTVVEVTEAALVNFTFRAGLGLVAEIWETQRLRDGRGCEGTVVGFCFCAVCH